MPGYSLLSVELIENWWTMPRGTSSRRFSSGASAYGELTRKSPSSDFAVYGWNLVKSTGGACCASRKTTRENTALFMDDTITPPGSLWHEEEVRRQRRRHPGDQRDDAQRAAPGERDPENQSRQRAEHEQHRGAVDHPLPARAGTRALMEIRQQRRRAALLGADLDVAVGNLDVRLRARARTLEHDADRLRVRVERIHRPHDAHF